MGWALILAMVGHATIMTGLRALRRGVRRVAEVRR
jgi:hypothetical protein